MARHDTIVRGLVSVIVLCYNQSRFVVQTLESVRRQTYQTIQLVIVDDCSTDSSVDVIRRWIHDNDVTCQFISHSQNQGICRTLNEALSMTTGEYVAIVAADDTWVPKKLERQVAFLDNARPDIGVVFSDAWRMDVNGEPLPGLFISTHRSFERVPQGDILTVLLDGNFIPALTPLIRRSCYDRVGLYDERLSFEDWDMWVRIATSFQFAFLDEPFGYYRVVPHSLTHRLLQGPDMQLKLDKFTIYENCLASPRGRRDFGVRLTSTMSALAEEAYAWEFPGSAQILRRALKAKFDLRTALMCALAFLRIRYGTFKKIDKWHTAFSHRAV